MPRTRVLPILAAIAVGAAFAVPSVAVAATPPTATSAPPATESPLGVGGYASCDESFSGAGWTGFDASTDYVSGYAWFRDGGELAGETSYRYLVVQADGGHSITCKDQVDWDHTVASGDPADLGTTALGLASNALAIPVLVKATNSVAPSISPDPAQTGDYLFCDPGTWSDAYATASYSWTRDGTPIAGATSYYYVVHYADEGHATVCIVTVENPGVAPGTLASDPVSSQTVTPSAVHTATTRPVVQTAPAVTPDTLYVGDVATCDGGSWDDPLSTLAFAWTSGGTPVGADAPTYTIVDADKDKPLVCTVIATNPIGASDPSASTPIAPVVKVPPAVITAPSIGETQLFVGQTAHCDFGTWTDPYATPSYVWSSGGSTVGTNASTYAIVAGDKEKPLVCTVTVTGAQGTSLPAASAPVTPTMPAAPVNTVAPTVNGSSSAYPGDFLSCDEGTWTGDALAFTFTFFAGASQIGTDSYYIVAAGDVSSTITCKVTATNAAGTQQVASSNGIVVVALADPANTVAPSIGAAGEPSTSFYCSVGDWSGGQITTSFVWKRDGTTTVGVANTSYTATVDDVGHTLTCHVTADNPRHHPATADSNGATIVSAGTPFPNSLPDIYPSDLHPTETAQCYGAYWAHGPIVSGYAWFRDGTSVGSGATYTVASADVGHALTCRETGSHTAGGAAVGTYTSLPVTPLPISMPTNTHLPTVTSGALVAGAYVSCVSGTWSGGALTYSYRWERDTTTITGAITSDYVATTADVGHTLRCRVTATNTAGHADTPSAATTTIQALTAPPAAAPSVYPDTGVTAGETVTCDLPSSPLRTAATIVWSIDGTALAGEQGLEYVVRTADAGHNLTCTATAINAAGSSAPTSSPGVPIAALAAPSVIGAPHIDADYQRVGIAGDRLTCRSSFTQAPNAYAYVWKRAGTPITGAIGRAYDTTAADAGQTLTCTVTATNTIGPSAPATSDGFAVAALTVPTVSSPPVLTWSGSTSDLQPGKIVYCSDGVYAGFVQSVLVRWLANGTAITGAFQSTYTLQSGDVGKTITCERTAYNGAGPSAASTSVGRAVVALTPPTATVQPTASGFPMPTLPLRCTGGAFQAVVDSIAVAWQRDGTAISGETATRYTVKTTDIGHAISCSLTATNGAGTSTPSVSPTQTIVPLIAPLPLYLPYVAEDISIGQTVGCSVSFGPPEDSSQYALKRDSGATLASGQSYTAATADAGHQVLCDVTATNAAGSTRLVSAVGFVRALARPTPGWTPVASIADVTHHVGEALTCTAPFIGNVPDTTTIGWQLGGGALADGASHPIVVGDLGGALRCVIGGTNGAGTGATASLPVVTAAAAAPYGGTATLDLPLAWVGDTLRCSSAVGDWYGSPATGYARTWTLNGATIGAATAESLLTAASQANHGIGCTVRASNDVGAGETATAPRVWLLPQASPFLLGQPYTTSGETTYPGSRLGCYQGSWGGGGIDFTYSWRRDGTAIAGATGDTYVARAGDATRKVGCVVKATNPLGTLTVVSAPITISTAPVQTERPVNTALPTISGRTAVGGQLTCDAGSWGNVPTTFAVIWRRAGKAIPGATADTYTLAKADAGYTITCDVDAGNNIGTTRASSVAVSVPTIVPVNVAAPKIGKAAVGKKAKVSTGTWVGAPVITYRYQWYRGKTKIKGATKSTYKVTKTDRKKKLTCRVTATDSAGSTTKASGAVTVK